MLQPYYAQDAPIISPSATLFLEGAAFSTSNDNFTHPTPKGGIGITDARLGFNYNYQSFSGKVNVNFAYNKVSIADIYVDKALTQNTFVRAGHFFHQYDLQNTYNPENKPTMQTLLTDTFSYQRQVGIMINSYSSQGLISASLVTDPSAIGINPQDLHGKQGFGAIVRAVGVLSKKTDRKFNLGLSIAYQTSPKDEIFNINFPAPTLLGNYYFDQDSFNNAIRIFKFSPEILYFKNKFALETQFYYNRISSKDFYGNKENDVTAGSYASLRFIVKGQPYSYNQTLANISSPSSNSMEILLGNSFVGGSGSS